MILPLCSCIVVTDTVPDTPWLLMVMAGLILLILTGPVRRENRAQGIRLTAMAAFPVVLALGGLFLAFPQEGYVNRSGVLRENILTAARHLPQILETGIPETAAGLSPRLPQTIDLAALGERIPFSYPVMEVTAEKNGTLYLRGRDYDQYDGLGWTATGDRTESFVLPDGPRQTIRIETRNRKQILYHPYYPASGVTLTAGAAENPEGRQAYALVCTALPDSWRQTAYAGIAPPAEQWQSCLSLPETTRQGAAPFLEQLQGRELSNTAKADIIAALVTDSARYDTRTGKMPSQEPDFALWFLRKADTGYCVHFATAAAVLLRSAGVPARYVTGYMVQARAGQTVTVTEEDAHAWAEYYEPALDLWIPLEATPASESGPAPQPLREEIPVITQPETRPEESAAETTVPTQAPSAPLPENHLSETGNSPSAGTGLRIFLPIAAVTVLMILQRKLRLILRRRKQRTGDPNRQALQRWQESVRLARLLKEIPTEELMGLAQKAKFSQYQLTNDELLQFDSFNRSCLRRLKKKAWYHRFVYQFVYAIY